MPSGFVIKKKQYYDSVYLMGVNARLASAPGVQKTAVLMASEKNKQLLFDFGLEETQLDAAGANDLVIAIVADSQIVVDDVLLNADQVLRMSDHETTGKSISTFEEALIQKPAANLVSISIPGEYAAREAQKAIDAGLHVFIFSSNVSVEDELALKQKATERNLLVMGPDCGTSLLGGIGLGFTNVVRRGTIGVVGAAGTGLQEFTCQVHNLGLGISHAIGIGTNDVSDAIGGLTAFSGIKALEDDENTSVIAFVSKPLGSQMLHHFINRIKNCTKPVVCCFLGEDQLPEQSQTLKFTRTIDETVREAIKFTGGKALLGSMLKLTAEEKNWIETEQQFWSDQQKFLRGIFAGGTFCYQSQQILRDSGITAYSDSPLDPQYKLKDPDISMDHSIVDMGDEYYTIGKPHPMIDGFLRRKRIETESLDPEVAVIFLDFILGYNASPDPVGDLLDAIEQAKQSAEDRGAHLTFVASVCGTEDDPQDMNLQIQMLKEQGVIVFTSNAKAALFCAGLVGNIGDQI